MAAAATSAPILDGQFSDAEEGTAQNNSRAGHNYIDTSESEDLYTPPVSESEDEEFDSDQLYEDTRVEDEDWEIAERGNLFYQRRGVYC
jgi:RIO kinase 1